MKLKQRVLIGLAGVTLPYMCAVTVLVLYLRKHPGPIPMWVPLTMFAFLVALCVLGGVYVSRFVRRQAVLETPSDQTQRQRQAAKGLKIGLVVFSLAFLNGGGLVLQDTVPWKYAIPGLTIDLFLIVVCWTSLTRLRRAQNQIVGQIQPKS